MQGASRTPRTPTPFCNGAGKAIPCESRSYPNEYAGSSQSPILGFRAKPRAARRRPARGAEP